MTWINALAPAKRYRARAGKDSIVIMKPHTLTSSVWLPLLVVVLLILGFAVLMLIAETGARIPPMPG